MKKLHHSTSYCAMVWLYAYMHTHVRIILWCHSPAHTYILSNNWRILFMVHRSLLKMIHNYYSTVMIERKVIRTFVTLFWLKSAVFEYPRTATYLYGNISTVLVSITIYKKNKNTLPQLWCWQLLVDHHSHI